MIYNIQVVIKINAYIILHSNIYYSEIDIDRTK